MWSTPRNATGARHSKWLGPSLVSPMAALKPFKPPAPHNRQYVTNGWFHDIVGSCLAT